MKKLLFMLLLLCNLPAFAQYTKIYRGAPPGGCSGPELGLDIANNNLYTCSPGFPFTLLPNNSSGTANALWAGNVQTVTPTTNGADACAKINTSYAALPTGGGVIDARGLGKGPYTCTTPIQIGTTSLVPALLLLDPYTQLTMTQLIG